MEAEIVLMISQIKYVSEDINSHVFNTLTRINEWKTKVKHISCYFKSKFDSRKCNSHYKWNKKLRQFHCKIQ